MSQDCPLAKFWMDTWTSVHLHSLSCVILFNCFASGFSNGCLFRERVLKLMCLASPSTFAVLLLLHWFYTDLKVKVLFRKVPHFLGLFGDFFLSDLYRPKVKVLFGTLLCRVCRKGRRRVSTSKLRVMEREDESDEEEEEEELLNRLLIAALMFEETLFGGPEKRKRSGNRKRNREHVQRTIDGWTDLMFRRQFRMTRSSFGKLRDIIDRQFPPRDGETVIRFNSQYYHQTICHATCARGSFIS